MKFVAPVFYISLLLIALLPARSIAQNVAINNDGSAPDTNAILDIKSFTKGILIPRTSTDSRLAIIDPPKGLMLYDTTTNNFWFYNGLTWSPVSDNSNSWSIIGNSGTDIAINFIGTTDAQPLRFRINNNWAGQLDPINLVFGIGSGQNISSGNSNTAFGNYSLNNITTGFANTAIGDNALAANIGSNNTGIGTSVLYHNIGGNYNTAVGSQALSFNSTGDYNSSLGYQALIFNTTGKNNTAMGFEALANNTTSNQNIAIGTQALYSQSFSNNSTPFSSNNIAIGIDALLFNNPTYTSNGVENTAIGNYSLQMNSTGTANNAIGYASLLNNTTGFGNIGIGRSALIQNTTGTWNIAIGYFSGTGVANLQNTISIGNNGYSNLASNQAFIGNLNTNWIGGQTTWFTFASDARVKNNVQEDVKGLAFISKLRPVTYNLNTTAMREISGNKETPDYPGKYDIEKIKQSGFIAQEVEQAAKETGYNFSGVTIPRNEHELYTMSYAQFVVPLVKGMQEQQKLIEELEIKLAALKTELDLLKYK